MQQALEYLRTACVIGKWGTIILTAIVPIMILIHIIHPIITSRPRSNFWIECALETAKYAVPLAILTGITTILMENMSKSL